MITSFKKAFVGACLTVSAMSAATAAPVPLTADTWTLSEKGAEFVQFQDRHSIHVKRGAAIIKDANFKNGIIEYDVWMEEGRGFGGVYFRENGDNAEYFYLRSHLSGKPDANQYVPKFNGNSAWQIFHGERYSAPTVYNFGTWTHVKLAIKDDAMDVYIDSDKPVLHVANLLLDGGAGDIHFSGGGQGFHYSNINVTATNELTLTGTEKPLKELAPGQIRAFDVSTKPLNSADIEAQPMLARSVVEAQTWTRLKVGETGVANLSEVSAGARGADTLLVRLQVTAEEAQTIPLKYGFSDRVTVFLNGTAISHDDDTYVNRDYRFLGTVGLFNSVFLPLNKGDNEVIFAVSEVFGGWAFLAAAENYPGVTIK